MPITFGKLDNNKCFRITSFVDGKSLDNITKELSNHDQYNIGLNLGENVKKIHSIKTEIPEYNESFNLINRYNERTELYKSISKKESTQLPEDLEHRIFEYVNKHLHNASTERCLIHNDIHDGNIMIKDNKFNGLIDFSEITYGNPHMDFKLLFFDSVYKFPYLCKGFVEGYCGETVGPRFWGRVKLYMYLYLLSANPIAKPDVYTKEEMLEEIDFLSRIDRAYEFDKKGIPKWYRNLSNIV